MPQLVASHLPNATTLKVRLVASKSETFGFPSDAIGNYLDQMRMGPRQAKLDANVERKRRTRGSRSCGRSIGKTVLSVLGIAEAAEKK